MAQVRKSSSRKRPPAKSPEARENQLISLAIDRAEQQLIDGTASATVITHYLKLATQREKLEQERIATQIRLDRAKEENLQSEKNQEELYTKAIQAMRRYQGEEIEDEDIP